MQTTGLERWRCFNPLRVGARSLRVPTRRTQALLGVFQSPSHRGAFSQRTHRALPVATRRRFNPLRIGAHSLSDNRKLHQRVLSVSVPFTSSSVLSHIRDQMDVQQTPLYEFQSPSHWGAFSQPHASLRPMMPFWFWPFQSPSHRGAFSHYIEAIDQFENAAVSIPFGRSLSPLNSPTFLPTGNSTVSIPFASGRGLSHGGRSRQPRNPRVSIPFASGRVLSANTYRPYRLFQKPFQSPSHRGAFSQSSR